MSSLKNKYKDSLRAELKKELKLENINEVPNLNKIVVSSGLGKANKDARVLDMMKEDLAALTGQVPAYSRAKKDISNFDRLRKGTIIGLYSTLRGKKMWDMMEKLVTVVLPGLKDFRGLSKKSFDHSGNYNVGIKQHTAFFEIDQNKLDQAQGLQITIVSNTSSKEHSYALLKKLGFPFND